MFNPTIDYVIDNIDRVAIDNTPLSEWDVIQLLGDIVDLHDRIEEVADEN